MYATVSLEEWFSVLGDFIVESHLNDKHGQADEHISVGEWMVDFRNLLNQ